MATFTLLIDNKNLKEGLKVKASTLKFNFAEPGTVSTLTFDMIDNNISGVPLVKKDIIGKPIKLYDTNGNLEFGGQLDEPEINKIDEYPKYKIKMIALDWHYMTKIKYVNNNYGRQLISDLFKQIVDDYLTLDGIWYDSNSIQETTDLYIAATYDYTLLSDSFDELCELINWQWKIDANKKIYFNDTRTDVGESLIENNGRYRPKSLYLNCNRDEYANQQILKNVKGITNQLTEYIGTWFDEVNTFNVLYPINSVPELYESVWENRLNPLISERIDPSLVGIKNVSSPEDGYIYFWNKGSTEISKSEDHVITSGRYLICKYYGQYSYTIVKTDNSQISARAAVEGTQGLYQFVRDGSEIESLDIGEEKTSALLERYNQIAKKIKVESYNINWGIGQIVDVIIPSFGISSLVSEGNGYLVIEKKIDNIGHLFLKSYTLCDGGAIGGWATFYSKWLNYQVKDWTLREEVEISQSYFSEESTNPGGTIVCNKITALAPSTSLAPSTLLAPGTFVSNNTYYD
jgi:hypothetical protein